MMSSREASDEVPPPGEGQSRLPLVSVIVPARNEEAVLGRCLRSLLLQHGISFEIIVVDDNSTDRTRIIAVAAGVPTIAAGPVPSGWGGKNHACAVGASVASGEWLLFTDADTVHSPGSLARAVAEARRHDAALLSYSPAQELRGLAQRSVMPLIFAELALNYDPQQVSDPNSSAAAANGQYLLVQRDAYAAVGGHAAVAGDLLEDVGLARAVKSAGFMLRFRFGGDAVRTYMYRDWPQMREGWTKNLTLLFADAEHLARRRETEFVASVGALSVAAVAALVGERKIAWLAAVLGAATTVGVWRRAQRAHSGTLSTALAPLGLPIFAYLLRRSRLFHSAGAVKWKGRSYPVRDGVVSSAGIAQAGSPAVSEQGRAAAAESSEFAVETAQER